MHPVVIEAARYFENNALAPVDENTSRELRGRIEKAMDDYHDLSLSVARMSERMDSIAEAIRNLGIISNAVADLRHTVDMKRLEHDEIRQAEATHQVQIDRISERLKQMDVIENRLKTVSWGWKLIIGLMITIFGIVVQHVFGGK